jgi:hypothetical protein
VPEVGPQVIVVEDDGENAGAPAPAPAFVENNGEDEEMEEEPAPPSCCSNCKVQRVFGGVTTRPPSLRM